MTHNEQYVFGTHVVTEVLSAYPDAVTALYGDIHHVGPEIQRLVSKHDMNMSAFDEKMLSKHLEGQNVHQKIGARINLDRIMRAYETFIAGLNVTANTALVVLGELHDPQNVGAIIRSAAAFGISGILFPTHRQVPLTATVAKVSAGACFRIPLVTVGNVNHTLEDLKRRGFWVYGLSEDATQSCAEELFERPSVFVVGNEGDGIRQKTLEHCDIPLRIPILSTVDSLNAATATAVTLFAWSVRHPGVFHHKQ